MSYAPTIVSPTLRERFEAKVELIPFCTCEIWTGALNDNGYGVVGVASKRSTLAHRAAWYLEHGVWPGPLRHSCDTPACVKVGHLIEGTQAENMQDMILRQRKAKGERTNLTTLTRDDVLDMRWLGGLGVLGYKLADMFGISRASVSLILNRKTWEHV